MSNLSELSQIMVKFDDVIDDLMRPSRNSELAHELKMKVLYPVIGEAVSFAQAAVFEEMNVCLKDTLERLTKK